MQQTSTAPVSNEPLQADGSAPIARDTSIDPRARTPDQLFSEVSRSVVKVIVSDANNVPIGGGSGVVTGRGVVITNCHVALRGPVVSVRTPKEAFSAIVALADETFDLCQLTVGDGFDAPPVEVGGMQYVRTGQKVYAIGAPQGLELTMSEGIVSSLRETRLGNVIQTTAAISPGSSGGGLFNVSGQLIGITTFQHKTGQNLNFAVPADWIAKMEPRSGPGPVTGLSDGNGSQPPQGNIGR
jgi:S1-C subfamily serine protease